RRLPASAGARERLPVRVRAFGGRRMGLRFWRWFRRLTGVALALWVSGLLAPGRAAAECGDYAHLGARRETLAPPAVPPHARPPESQPCSGPTCSGRPTAPVPVPGVAPTESEDPAALFSPPPVGGPAPRTHIRSDLRLLVPRRGGDLFRPPRVSSLSR